MRKTILYLLLSITTLNFIGCGETEPLKKSTSPVNTIESSNTNVETYTPFSLSDSYYSYCPFVFNDMDLIFANPDENNRLSTIPSPLPKNILDSKSVTDFVDYYADNLVLTNGVLYFSNGSDGNTLSSLTLTDKTVTKLTEHSVQDLVAVDNNLYYINKTDSNKLYKYDTNSKKSIAVTLDSVGKYIVSGDFVVYENLSDSSKLYSIKVTGKNKQKLTDYTANSFIPYEGQLLFFNSSDKNGLYSLDPSTLETKRIAIMNGFDLKSIDDSLYFINGDDSNYLYKLTVNLEKPEASYKVFISESINEYYPTTEGIFYEKGINVNNIYFKIASGAN